MMKKTISNIRTMAALLMAGAAFAACSSSDDIINEQPVNTTGKQGYTLTVSASKDAATTRALDVDGSAVVASWETTDEIVVTKGTAIVGTLSPTIIDGLNATFSGTVDGDFAATDVLTLTYHPIASLSAFASQNGTLNGSATSAENFDMAVATVTISEITGNKIIVSESSADFVNQTAVVVLTPHASYQDPGVTAGISSLVVSVMMDIPEVGTVTEEIGPITISGDLPYYFSLPSQSLLADFLAAKYSLTASEISTLLASATITFTGQQYGVYYLTCDKTGYKFAAGKYYKLDENNFVMTEVLKRSAAGKDVYVENQDGSWSNTVTFAVNRGIGWRVDGDYVFWGDKQLYVVDTFDPLNPFEGWVRASDNVKLFGATYSLRDPEPAPAARTLADVFTDGAVVSVKVNTENRNWYGVTGTYNAGSGKYTTAGSGTITPTSVSMIKDGDNLVASVTDYNTYTVTFNTTDNTYTESATSDSSPWRMTTLNSITINGTDITSTLTNATPVATTKTWNFSEIGGSADLRESFTRDGIVLSCDDGGDLDFDRGSLRARGNLTLSNTLGKKFTSIVINSSEHVDISGFDFDYREEKAIWTGNASSITFSGNYGDPSAEGITSIVFTLE